MKTRKQHATAYLFGDVVYLIIQGMPMTDVDTGMRKYGRLRVSTGVELRGTGWDKNRELPRDPEKAKEVRRQLAKLDAAYDQARKERNLVPQYVREVFEGTERSQPMEIRLANRGHYFDMSPLTPEQEAQSKAIREAQREYWRRELSGETTNGQEHLLVDIISELEALAKTEGGRKQYATFRNKVIALAPTIKMGEINDEWRRAFLNSLKVRYSLGDNSMWGQQKYLNRAINYAKEEKGVEIKVKSKSEYRLTPAKKDYLDWQDIARLIKFKVTAKREDTRRKLEDAKTHMLTYCLTSIRIGDTWQFFDSIQTRNGIECASFHCKKSPHPLVMPIVLAPLKAQIKKAGRPKYRSEDKIRQAITELMAVVGIQKHITPHTGRNSFITNFLHAAPTIPDKILCSVFTGHRLSGASSDRRVFEGYNQALITADQVLFLRLLKEVDPKHTGGIKLL